MHSRLCNAYYGGTSQPKLVYTVRRFCGNLYAKPRPQVRVPTGETMSQASFLKTAATALILLAASPATLAQEKVKVESGLLLGTTNTDRSVRIFKAIPFAAPPIGDLRWKSPQPTKPWSGVRAADKFGSACMQTDVFGDILQFMRDAQPSEDCLNLNIWLPASATAKSNLPVYVWYYGGGFVAGGNFELRYDGQGLAKKGVIVVRPNYRPRVFGFLSYSEVAKEFGRRPSGDYGMLDQV